MRIESVRRIAAVGGAGLANGQLHHMPKHLFSSSFLWFRSSYDYSCPRLSKKYFLSPGSQSCFIQQPTKKSETQRPNMIVAQSQ